MAKKSLKHTFMFMVMAVTIILQIVTVGLCLGMNDVTINNVSKNWHFYIVKAIFANSVNDVVASITSKKEGDPIFNKNKDGKEDYRTVNYDIAIVFYNIGFIILAIIGCIHFVNKYVIKNKLLSMISTLLLLLASILSFVYLYKVCGYSPGNLVTRETKSTNKFDQMISQPTLSEDVNYVVFANTVMTFLYCNFELLSLI